MTELAERLAKLSPAQRALLDRKVRERNQRPELGSIPKRTGGNRVPLTVDQERIWLIHQFDPADPAYNVFFAYRLRGALDVAALERAVNAFAARHEALRTTFESDGERPVQVVHDAMPITVPLRDLTGVPEADREDRLRAEVADEVRRPFDLTTGPLLRVTLLRVGERDHLMVGTVDHLVWDRASLGILNAELAEFYAAFVEDRPPRLDELDLHYPDYAEWQPHWLRDEVARRHLPYWRDQLAGAELVLELPADRPRPPVQTFNGARYQFRLTPGLTAGIRELARREDVTINVALLAAWQLLLHRLTGQRDIVVGTTSSTRSRPETERMIGYFLTMLPLRTTVTPTMTFRELLTAARRTMLGAYDHADIPFGTLLDELDIDRDPSRTPVYQSTFILVDFVHEDAVRMPGLDIETLMFDNRTAKDDVTVGFFDEEALGEDHFFGLLEYNTDLFDEATVARMSRQLTRLLEQVVADPGRPVGELSLLDAQEARTVLVEWNRTEVAMQPGARVADLVLRAAEARPGAVAVSCGDERIGYAELVGRAGRLAAHLQSAGVGRETVVGVCLERSADLVVGLLGVLLSGGAYLPLDPAHPAQRLADLVADAGAPVVLTRSGLAGDWPARRVCLDTDAAAIAARTPVRDSSGGGDRLAYVSYTSGSTGRPKGVEVTQGGLVNLLLSMVDELGIGTDTVLPAVTSVSFDIAGLELFGPLISGGRVVVVPREQAQDGAALAALLDRVGATVLQATPATWQLLVESGWRNDGRLRVVVGGEALPPALAQLLVTGPGRTWNVYGPTETTIWSTACRIDDGTAPISIGRPLANTRAYVLDERLAPVPVGVPGDLYLGGAGVARGYRGRPALTAERFVPDHLGGVPGATLYRTGDRARWRPDGTLMFLGRDDGQIKLRGYRIELGEIEARLAEHPGVRRAVALVREDRPGDRRLVGYVQPGEPEPEEQDLREHLRAVLPDYMVPAAFVPVPEFPLSSAGKVDRRALPAPPTVRGAADYAPPRDPVELEVARIWEDVLGTRPIGVHDRFFDLGGHSLLVLRLMAEIGRRFGTRLPMAAIFQGATVERFAAMLRDGFRPQTGAHLAEIRAGDGGSPVFFAHPAGSEVVCYMPFAELVLPEDRPLYALASPPPVDGVLPYAAFEERAAAYAALIRQVQPKGPYVVAGWCYGGANAFAVGRELERGGDTVSVVVVDAPAPAPLPGTEPDRAEIVEAIAVNLRWDYGADLASLGELRAMSDDEHLDYLLGIARAADYVPPDAGREQIAEVVELWVANLRLLWRYRPEPLAGRLTVIGASQEDHVKEAEWRELAAGELRIRAAEGNHYTVLRSPGIETVAAVVTEVADA